MEEVKDQWTCKLPPGHARMLLTFRVIERKTGVEIASNDKTEEDALKPAQMQFSKEVQDFIDGCTGEVSILKSTFEIRFSNNEDYVRYRMTDFPERNPF